MEPVKVVKLLKDNGYSIDCRIIAAPYFSLLFYKIEAGMVIPLDLRVRFPDYTDPAMEVVLERMLSDLRYVAGQAKTCDMAGLMALKWNSIAHDQWNEMMGRPIYSDGETSFDVYTGLVNRAMRIYGYFGEELFKELVS